MLHLNLQRLVVHLQLRDLLLSQPVSVRLKDLLHLLGDHLLTAERQLIDQLGLWHKLAFLAHALLFRGAGLRDSGAVPPGVDWLLAGAATCVYLSALAGVRIPHAR